MQTLGTRGQGGDIGFKGEFGDNGFQGEKGKYKGETLQSVYIQNYLCLNYRNHNIYYKSYQNQNDHLKNVV